MPSDSWLMVSVRRRRPTAAVEFISPISARSATNNCRPQANNYKDTGTKKKKKKNKNKKKNKKNKNKNKKNKKNKYKNKYKKKKKKKKMMMMMWIMRLKYTTE